MLVLLRHLVRSSDAAFLAIVATYRETELGRSYPLAEMLIKLRREQGVTRLRLRGLDVSDLRTLVDTIAGTDAPSHLAALIADSTEGNPFFATEMLRHLKETGAIAGLVGTGGGVQEITDLGCRGDQSHRPAAVAAERRVQPRGDLAAVIGREFDIGVLGL